MKKKRRETGYIKYLTDDEFKAIKKFVDQDIRAPPSKMCIEIMMYLGLRVGEAVALKRDNFSKDFSRLIYMPSKNKYRRVHERVVPDFLKEKLQTYHKRFCRRYRNGYMFPPFMNGSKNNHILKFTIANWFIKIRRKLNFNHIYYMRKNGKPLFRISPHTLRHYAVWRYYVASGKDLRITQQIIGHKKIQTTADYINAVASSGNEKRIVEAAFS